MCYTDLQMGRSICPDGRKLMLNWLRKILFVLLLGIFLYSSVTLIRYWCNSRKQAELFTDLALSVENAKEAPVSTVDPELPTLPGKTPDTPRRILPEYQALYQRNSDMAGWISIPDTCINYPVMHTPQAQDAYLYANFQKEYSAQGSIFAQGNCDLNRPSDNIILYGHNMRDGSMFAALSSYLDPDFYAEHRIICFDSLYERRTYEIICVFITTATLGEGFDYPAFVEALSPEDFDAYVDQCMTLSEYDTGISAKYGDHLLTLSTCNYSRENGRLVVVAKQAENEE